jgi:glucoamylase
MVNSANAMLAAGDCTTPLRALIYLDVSQERNGGFAQNFWIDGEPYWRGVQLDEVAYPILLAWRLKRDKGLEGFDPYPNWSGDEWKTVRDTPSSTTELGVEFADVPIPATQQAPVRFTFFWMASRSWEGRDYMVSAV